MPSGACSEFGWYRKNHGDRALTMSEGFVIVSRGLRSRDLRQRQADKDARDPGPHNERGFVVVSHEGDCLWLETVHSDERIDASSVGKLIDGYSISSALECGS